MESAALSSNHDLSRNLDPQDPEKHTTPHDLSTSSTPPELEKDSASDKQSDGDSLSQQLSRQLSHRISRIATSDYPTGFRLSMIVVALVLSIFLVSLDMVSFSPYL
jgi:hypothetical protein